MRETDIQELKSGIKDISNVVRDIDKNVAVHTEKFNSLGNIKEVTERTSESTKSAHKRIDEVEKDLKLEISEIKLAQENQFNDFKQIIKESNNDLKKDIKKTNEDHLENYKSIKSFSWKVFFIFATPTAAGIIALLLFR